MGAEGREFFLCFKIFKDKILDSEPNFSSCPLSRYLHELCHPPVIHRDLKSANILLDEDLSVRVSDCGLAPLITSGSVSQVQNYLILLMLFLLHEGNDKICEV